MSPTWGIRTASSRQHGAGHVRRCLALAAALEGGVRFYLDDDYWSGRLAALGIDFEVEDTPCDSGQVLSAVQKDNLRGIIFDGYMLKREDCERAKQFGLAVHLDDGIVDLPAHCRINPGAIAISGISLAPRTLAGFPYALLDSCYVSAHHRALERNLEGCGSRLLISMGARDSKNVTGMILEACEGLPGLEEIHVLLGEQADHIDMIARKVDRTVGAKLIVDCEDMIAEYQWAQIAVGAGGVSMLERMCCGLPSFVVAQTENQNLNIRAAIDGGAIFYLGGAEQLDANIVRRNVQGLINSPTRLSGLRIAGLGLVDGLGAKRVAKVLGRVLKKYENGLLPL